MNLQNSILVTKRTYHPKRILVVEDDPHWQMLISRAVKIVDPRASLRCVRSVKHAQDLLYSNSNFDLIVADHFLDGAATGIQLWQECKSQRRRIPFVLVSGISNTDLDSLLEEEFDRPTHFRKSPDLVKLTSVIHSRLSESMAKSGVWNSLLKRKLL